MSQNRPRNSAMSRREVLMAPWQRFRRQDSRDSKTGWDASAREADALLRQGHYQQALAAYRNCIAQDPEHIEAHKKMVVCYCALQRYAQAQKVLVHLRQKQEDDFIHLYTGIVAAFDGDLPTALNAWKQYANYDQPLVLRAINLQLALEDSGEAIEPIQAGQAVLDAIEEQRRRDRGAVG
ncbi:MAG: tetratricopeptide repeat protein [Thermodesulfobacteriota bacterium]